jgi:hypothetical protein
MLILKNIDDLIQIKLGEAIINNQCDCMVVFRETGTGEGTVYDGALVRTQGVTPVTFITSPSSADSRKFINTITIFNNDSITHQIIIVYKRGINEGILYKGNVPSNGILSYENLRGWDVLLLNPFGYAINVQALTSSPADTTPFYFGMKPSAITTTAGQNKIYIRKAGTLKIAEIYTYAGTAGTAEAVSMYVRVNNTTDYLIQTLGVSANERVFSNTGLNIPLAVGDYVEIKCIPPIWATNPLTFIAGGYIYIE